MATKAFFSPYYTIACMHLGFWISLFFQNVFEISQGTYMRPAHVLWISFVSFRGLFFLFFLFLFSQNPSILYLLIYFWSFLFKSPFLYSSSILFNPWGIYFWYPFFYVTFFFISCLDTYPFFCLFLSLFFFSFFFLLFFLLPLSS